MDQKDFDKMSRKELLKFMDEREPLTDAQIRKNIASDPDTIEVTKEMFDGGKTSQTRPHARKRIAARRPKATSKQKPKAPKRAAVKKRVVRKPAAKRAAAGRKKATVKPPSRVRVAKKS